MKNRRNQKDNHGCNCGRSNIHSRCNSGWHSRRRCTSRLAAGLLTASIGAAAVCGTSFEARAAAKYDSRWTDPMSWEDTIEPELLVETDNNMIYQQLRLCMRYRVIPEGDIWDLNQARRVKMPLEVMKKLYDGGYISGYLYKKFSGEIWDWTDLKDVFDPAWYYNAQKSRLAGIIAPNDYVSLTLDFIGNGMPNGWRGSEDFDPAYYRQKYPDLDKLYGDDWAKYYNHYILYGLFEGREGVKHAHS